MSGGRSQKLKVVVSGSRRFIDVPTDQGLALSRYLRANGVPSSPPQPSSVDVDSIEIDKGPEVAVIQALLDRWA